MVMAAPASTAMFSVLGMNTATLSEIASVAPDLTSYPAGKTYRSLAVDTDPIRPSVSVPELRLPAMMSTSWKLLLAVRVGPARSGMSVPGAETIVWKVSLLRSPALSTAPLLRLKASQEKVVLVAVTCPPVRTVIPEPVPWARRVGANVVPVAVSEPATVMP